MSARSELEGKLIAFCAAQTPPIPMAMQGGAFIKPADGSRYVQSWMLAPTKTNPTVEGTRERVRGMMQINIYCPDGKGTKAIETLAAQIAAMYPMAPKELFTEVSIEQSAQTGQIFNDLDGPYLCVPITVKYRQEL